jgi:hypothetical protein
VRGLGGSRRTALRADAERRRDAGRRGAAQLVPPRRHSVASRSRPRASLPKMRAMHSRPEPVMNNRLAIRSVSFVLAMAVTLSLLGGIDSLASSEAASASAQWAAAVSCPRV